MVEAISLRDYDKRDTNRSFQEFTSYPLGEVGAGYPSYRSEWTWQILFLPIPIDSVTDMAAWNDGKSFAHRYLERLRVI